MHNRQKETNPSFQNFQQEKSKTKVSHEKNTVAKIINIKRLKNFHMQSMYSININSLQISPSLFNQVVSEENLNDFISFLSSNQLDMVKYSVCKLRTFFNDQIIYTIKDDEWVINYINLLKENSSHFDLIVSHNI